MARHGTHAPRPPRLTREGQVPEVQHRGGDAEQRPDLLPRQTHLAARGEHVGELVRVGDAADCGAGRQ